MLKVFYKTFKNQFLMEYLFLFFMNVFKIISSVCIRNLIDDIANDKPQSRTFMWAGIIAASNILFILSMHHSNKINYCLFSSIRVMFMKSLYMKVSNLSAFTIKEANIGKLVNLVSGDLTTIEVKSYLIICLSIVPIGLVSVAVVLYFR